MRVPLPQLLELTRKVFNGEISRTQLAKRTTYEQAFVGTAIMLAARDFYLVDSNLVKGPYSRHLERLLSAGIVNPYTTYNKYKNGDALMAAARRADLYRSAPGRGGSKPIMLHPPPQLDALVQELGLTPSISVFIEESWAGVAQEDRWGEEYRQSTMR